jgi:hypothetical protein
MAVTVGLDITLQLTPLRFLERLAVRAVRAAMPAWLVTAVTAVTAERVLLRWTASTVRLLTLRGPRTLAVAVALVVPAVTVVLAAVQ